MAKVDVSVPPPRRFGCSSNVAKLQQTDNGTNLVVGEGDTAESSVADGTELRMDVGGQLSESKLSGDCNDNALDEDEKESKNKNKKIVTNYNVANPLMDIAGHTGFLTFAKKLSL